MRRDLILCACVLTCGLAPAAETDAPRGTAPAVRRLSVREYRDKMKGGWIGQIVGVAWGAPTEFKFQDKIIPLDAMPTWKPEMINHAFGQDDLYVEMTFLRSMEVHGLDVSIRQAGIDFAESGYPLWCANNAGRTNLRRGIAPPDSGHPRFNKCPNDIDYQIEADYSGLIAPGLPNTAIAMGEKFGRLMNYGDGVYAGQFMGGMYAEAFFETDIRKVIEAGLRCIPAESQYAEMVRDMLAWHGEDSKNWEATWKKAQAKYREDPRYQKASNGGIDAKINGAYVLMGLLFGAGDPDATVVISCRSGQDSDCNPSSAAGVLFTTLGFSKLPPRFRQGLDEKAVFSHTAYDFPALLDVCEKLARASLLAAGGSVEKDTAGEECFAIRVQAPRPSPLELSWNPGPIAGSRFTSEERALITATNLPPAVKEGIAKFAPGWGVKDCGSDMDPGLLDEWGGQKGVLVTHPLDHETPCVLSREFELPAGSKSALRIRAGHHPQGDWGLTVRVDEKEILSAIVGKGTSTDGWCKFGVDLSPFAGKKVLVEIVNRPTGWAYEGAYWGAISLESN